jgi:hypothetical protein
VVWLTLICRKVVGLVVEVTVVIEEYLFDGDFYGLIGGLLCIILAVVISLYWFETGSVDITFVY